MKRLRLPLKPTFNEFVEGFGGELLDKLLPDLPNKKKADYLFREPLVVAELKCIERDVSTPEYRKKLERFIQKCMAEDVIKVYGRAPVYLRRLPKARQDEWLDILEAPIQKQIFVDGNKQIRETKERLGIPNAKGVILLANEGSYSLGPADILTLLARISQKRKLDGQPICSNIHRIVLFSFNVPLTSSQFPDGIVPWLPAFRPGQEDAETGEFLVRMGKAWVQFWGSKTGLPLTEVKLDPNKLEGMQFVP